MKDDNRALEDLVREHLADRLDSWPILTATVTENMVVEFSDSRPSFKWNEADPTDRAVLLHDHIMQP